MSIVLLSSPLYGASEDKSAQLTGNSAAAAVGAVAVGLALALSGAAATGAVGTVGPSVTVALTGVAATCEVGNVLAPLVGVQATCAAGTVAPTITLSASGNVGTASVGNVSLGISIAASGNAATGAVGTVGVTEAEFVALNGNAATGAAGNVSPGISKALTGNAATGAAGTLDTVRNLLRHEFVCLMRFTGYNYGSLETYRSAAWHSPLIVDVPQPEESLRDEFGIQSGDTLEVTVADTALRTTLEGGTLDGASVTLEWITTSYYTRGAPVESVFTRVYTVKGYTYRPGLVTLRMVNLDDVRLTAVYPTLTFNARDWPEIFLDHINRAVPVAVGTAIKIPCTLIKTGAGAGPWKFAVCHPSATVLTVYRNGRVVAASEYTVSTIHSEFVYSGTDLSYDVVVLSFTSEQVDFNGNLHVIEADVTSANSFNAVTELNRILTAAGVTVDATTFAAGATYATTNVMRVDWAYTEQREYSAIVYDLLHVCRASLKRNNVGAYELVQDASAGTDYSYSEADGDLVEVTEYRSAEPTKTFTLAYRENPSDRNRLQYLTSRSAGGVAGTEHLDAPYIRDHECADRFIDYLAKRRQYGATARANVYTDTIELNQVISLTSDSMWTGAKSWRVRSIRRLPGCNECDLIQYSASIYTYTPGTYPADATTGYSPDYSATPPLTPTAVTVVSGGVTLNTDGVALSYALVKSTPPTVNWKEIWFQITNTVTNEIYLGRGDNNGDGTYGTRIPGLRPNVAHTLVSWAVNAFNVQGVVSAAVNFTSTAWTSAPTAPTSLSAVQGTGKIVKVGWTNPTSTNIREIQVHRKIGAGAYSQVATVQGTSYDDTNVSYGSTYTYKAVAVDRAGNVSVDSGTSAVTPQANVNTPDLTNNGVTTEKRQVLNSMSQSYSVAPLTAVAYQFTHNLGVVPLATIGITGQTGGDISVDYNQSFDASATSTFYVVLYNRHSTSTSTGTVHALFW